MFKASAPGSLMILGEYAVLENGHALVAAVDHRMVVELIPRSDLKIKINSQLGFFETQISNISISPPFQFVLTVLKKFQNEFKSGFNLLIASDFSDQIGFASSSAVTVATLAVCMAWLNKEYNNEKLILDAREIIRTVQGIGSGADVAACVLGGMLLYRATPFLTEKLPFDYPLTIIYSGSKTKTVDAIKQVQTNFLEKNELHQKILRAIDACAIAGAVALRKNNYNEFGKIFNIQQGLMSSLGVSTKRINTILQELLDDEKSILGAKISGSGLGDCVIGLGEYSKSFPEQIKAKVTNKGLVCEKS